eukprot:CAMPEP_0117754700 /NCGR_PEP_ID=MMETSP0947-20121206/12978_1 /TAXON_ID=44440 /ORGANISM="Chattonella subsalsa, Strain CCMP2191" /LENGTH=71 /DNA_ID=CAMNT_0005573825 /DNA_START=713 /DNA_END=928 /DNA_ORIENTATION=+
MAPMMETINVQLVQPTTGIREILPTKHAIKGSMKDPDSIPMLPTKKMPNATPIDSMIEITSVDASFDATAY